MYYCYTCFCEISVVICVVAMPYNYVVSVIATAVCIVSIAACVIAVVTAWLILPHV